MADANDQQQALAAFEHAGAELRFFKSQQWSAANYTLLAEATAVTVPALLKGSPAEAWARCAAIVIAIIVPFVGGLLIASLERAMVKERKRMSEARKRLPALDAIHGTQEAEARGDVAGALYVAIALGAAIAIADNVALLFFPPQ